jgi:hypothetical protein
MSSTVDQHPIDIEQKAESIDVVPAIVKMLIKIGEDIGHPIRDIEGYNNAIGIVKLETPIGHNDGGREEYALLNPNGFIFPFDPKDSEGLTELCEAAGLDSDAAQDSTNA